GFTLWVSTPGTDWEILAGLGSGVATSGAAAGAFSTGGCSTDSLAAAGGTAGRGIWSGRAAEGSGVGSARLRVMTVGGAAFDGFTTVTGVLTTVAGARFTASGCLAGAGAASA